MLIRGIEWLFTFDFDEGNSIANIIRIIIFNLLLSMASSFSFASPYNMLHILGILLFVFQGFLLIITLCMLGSRSD